MSEDHRFLPFFIREPVYVVPEPDKPPAEPTPPTLPVAGSITSPVLILTDTPEHPFLSSTDQTFLEKILNAVNLSTNDIALVNWHPVRSFLEEGAMLDQYLPGHAYQTLIVFGEVPHPWSKSNFFEAYVVKTDETQRYLQADTLEILSHDPEQKVRLWKCLQQLFL